MSSRRRRRSPEVKASPGRGARRWLKFGAGTVELLDESYNANPASMRAMLAVLARTEPASGGRRLLAMGDMRELGEQADAFHAGLADAVAASGAAQVFLCGPHMEALWQRLAAAQKGVHRPDSAALAGEVAAALQGRGRDRGQGLAGLENEECRRCRPGGKRRRSGTLTMFYNFVYPAGGRLQPVQPLPLSDVPLDRGVPDGAGAELPDRRRPDPLAAQQAGRRASRSARTGRRATSSARRARRPWAGC